MSHVKHVWNSTAHALRGLRYAFVHESNFRMQCMVGVLVIVAMLFFQTTLLESIVLVLLICAVLVLELFNTVVEALADVVKPRLHEQVKLVKDIAAGMVFLMSLVAAGIGIVMFYPYVLALVG